MKQKTSPGRRRTPSSPSGSAASSRKPLLAALGVLLVGAAVYKLVGREPDDAPLLSAVPAATEPRPAKAAATRNRLSAKPAAGGAPAQQASRNLQAGFKSVGNTVGDDGRTRLKVTVQTMPVCHPGDLEAMSLVVGDAGHMLLSVEPIAASGEAETPVATRKVSLAEIRKAVTFDLPLTRPGSNIYGIYLCADRARTGACGQKKPADFNAILNRLAGSTKPDPIFYFQFAAIKASATMVYSGRDNGLPDAGERLASQKLGGDNLEADLERVASLMRGVQSFPPITKAAGDDTAMVIRVATLEGRHNCGGRSR